MTVDVFDADPAAGGQTHDDLQERRAPGLLPVLGTGQPPRDVPHERTEPGRHRAAHRARRRECPFRDRPGGRPVLLGLRRPLETHPPHGEYRLGGVPRRGGPRGRLPRKRGHSVRVCSAPLQSAATVRRGPTSPPRATTPETATSWWSRRAMGRAARRSRSVGPLHSRSTQRRPPSPSSRQTWPRILRRRSRRGRSGPSTQPRAKCGRCSTAMCSHSSGRPTGKPSRRSTFARRTVARAPARQGRRALGWLRRPPARPAPPSRRSRRTRRGSASTCRSSTRRRPPSAPSATSGSRSCSHSRWSPTSISTPGVIDFWAPDNSAIVLPLTDEDNLDHVVVIPADGGDPHEVATGWIGFWSP